MVVTSTVLRMPDGRDSLMQRGKAQLVIEVKGDSAFGTWTTGSTSGQQRIIKLRGTRTGNSVKLVSEPQSGSRVTPSGTTSITFVTTYEATVSADAIVGSMTNQSQSAQPTAATPRAGKFEGKRETR